MTQDITPQEAMQRLEEHFGGREGMLTHTLTMLSTEPPRDCRRLQLDKSGRSPNFIGVPEIPEKDLIYFCDNVDVGFRSNNTLNFLPPSFQMLSAFLSPLLNQSKWLHCQGGS